MGIIFISHSNRDNDRAIKVRDWLRDQGWRETFLDLDPEQGLAPGQRWQDELKAAGERCVAVVVLVSPDWLQSYWCRVELLVASQLGKHIFGVIVCPTPMAEIPSELAARYQLVDISEAATEADGFERLRFGLKRAGLDPRDFPWPPPHEPNRPAYRGLRALDEGDAGIFFGRSAPITGALDALRRIRAGGPERLLVILGASGAGKSSFLKAGLLARLRRDEENFQVLRTLRPERLALSGPDGLLHALGMAEGPPDSRLPACLAQLRRSFRQGLGFPGAAGESISAKPPTLILPIDQAEELFAGANSEAAATLDLLKRILAADENFLIVLTLRSDSLGRLQEEARLEDFSRLLFDLPRLPHGAYKEVIEGPGRLARPEIRFEPSLVDRLLADLDSQDALPLLSFTLERLTAEYGKEGRVGLEDFVQGFGGLEGAIDRAVEAAFGMARLNPSLPRQRTALEDLARQAFLPWLVSVGGADEAPKRRVATLDEIPAACHELVRHLVDQRLLVSDSRGSETTVEVSHEAVFRHWRLLAVWVDEEREALRSQSAVEAAAKEWQRHTALGDPDRGQTWLLHRGERLANAESLLHRLDYHQLFGDLGRAYLAACRHREDAERLEREHLVLREQESLSRQRLLQRRASVALLVVAVAVVVFGVLGLRQTRAASQQVSLVLSSYARRASAEGYHERAIRLAALAAREGFLNVADPAAAPILASAARRSSLITEFRGHQAGIRGLSLTPDQNSLLTWGWDKTARVWNAKTGAETALLVHEREINGAALDATGKRVLSWDGGNSPDGSNGGTVRVWDAATGSRIAAMDHEFAVEGALWDATSSRVFSWDCPPSTLRVRDPNLQCTVKLWDVAKGLDLAVLKVGGLWHVMMNAARDRVLFCSYGIVHVWDTFSGFEILALRHDRLDGATFDPSGKLVISSGRSGVRVWSGATGAEVAAWPHAGLWREVPVFDAIGERIAFAEVDGTVRIWSTRTGAEIAVLKSAGRNWPLMFDAAGKSVLTRSDDGIVRIWDVSPGAEIASLKQAREAIGATFDPTGKNVLSWSAGGILRVWNAVTGAESATSKHQSSILGAQFDSGGERVLSWSGDGTVRLWDAVSGAEIASSRHDGNRVSAMFDIKEKNVLSWSDDGIARLWSASGAAQPISFNHDEKVSGAIFDAKGERVLSWSEDGTARVWNAATGEAIAEFEHDFAEAGGAAFLDFPEVAGAMFDRSEERVLSWDDHGKASVWNASTGAEIATSIHEDAVGGATFDVPGKRVLSWSEDGTARVWDAATGREIAAVKHEGEISGATFDNSQERVLSWDDRGISRLWNAATGVEVAVSKMDGKVSGALFDPTGERVLTWGDHGKARVWSVATAAEIAAFQHGGPVNGATFDSSGSRVLSWSEDGTARVWNAATGAEIASNRHNSGVKEALFDVSGAYVLSLASQENYRIWDAATCLMVPDPQRVHFKNPGFDPAGERVLSWGRGRVSLWHRASVELADFELDGVKGAIFDDGGRRVLAWSREGALRIWDVSWSIRPRSTRSLMSEVCAQKLGGTEAALRIPLVNAGGDLVEVDSVRRISMNDAADAPVLRNHVGEDVCSSPFWW